MDSLYNVYQAQVKSILSELQGTKVLILDYETTGILSVLLSQTELLEASVGFVVNINEIFSKEEFKPNDTIKFLPAICVLRPTRENFNLLEQLLKLQLFSYYHLYFTCPLTERQVDKLAQADVNENVKLVSSIACDFLMLSPNLFTLELQSCHGLLFPTDTNHSMYESYCFERILSGLVSALFTFCTSPFAGIYYSENSSLCRTFTDNILAYLQTYGKSLKQSVFDTYETDEKPSSVLLLFDRREDVVTPLVIPWTYEAMIHEYFNIDRNIVCVKAPKVLREQRKNESIVLNVHTDKFFRECRYTIFGELSAAINECVQELHKMRENATSWNQAENSVVILQNLKNLVQKFPEQQRYSAQVSNHVRLVHELSNVIEDRDLLQIGRLQQELLSSPSLKNAIYNEILDLLKVRDLINSQDQPNSGCDSKTISCEVLVLCLLFILQYRRDHAKTSYLIRVLQNYAVDVAIIDQILSYVGPYFDTEKEFSTLDVAKDVVSRNLNSKKTNIFLSHKSVLSNIVNDMIRNNYKSLKKNNCEFAPFNQYNVENTILTNIIIFVIGGATYKESYDLNNLQSDGTKIVLGGTTIHNSKSFLSEVALVQADNNFLSSYQVFKRKPALNHQLTNDITKIQQFINTSW